MIITNIYEVEGKVQKIFVIPHEPCFFTYGDVRDILDCAMFDIFTWCDGIEFDADARKLNMIPPDEYGLCLYDRFLQYGSMTIIADGNKHILTTENFFNAIEKSVDLGVIPFEYFSDDTCKRIDVSDIDSWMADNIFQRAVFDDVIYC